MIDTPTIRRATLKDAAIIRELSVKTFRDSFGAQNSAEDMATYLENNFLEHQIKEELITPKTVFLLALKKETVMGYAKAREHAEQGRGIIEPALEIERLYVAQEYIGTGIGAALMESCLAYAKESNYNEVWLGVWEHNHRAITFYNKYGFTRFGSHPFILGNDVQTDLLMKRKVL